MSTPTFKHFKVEKSGNVAVVRIDVQGESVNTLSPEVGAEFSDLLARFEKDDSISALVLGSNKKDNFVAGASIDFLKGLTSAKEGEEASRGAQEGFNRLEAYPKPVVAAIDGSALGGGLEWALACRYRIASDSPKTSLGLPEVQLGLLPGAGGTQRLPRLIGAQAALDLILTGKNLKAKKALKLGVVDEVVPQPILLSVAITRAQELASGGRKISRERGLASKGQSLVDSLRELALEDNPLGRKVLFSEARKQLFRKTRGKYPAPEKALEVVQIGLDDGLEEGLKAEAKAFGELLTSQVSKQLVEIFFATTALKKENGTSDASVKPRPVKKVGVLGGGLMGGGIAFVTSQQMKTPVRIREKDDAGAGRALAYVRGLFDERVKRRSMTARERDAQMSYVTATTDFSGFKSVDVVIEAVFEDLQLKQNLIREVEKVVPETTIFASNTSSLPIAQLAQASSRPHTVIGMHYFSPVHKMPLLEIITHKGTADWVTATCVEIGKRQGKTVIVVNDGVGFYTSRILAPFMNEAAFLLGEGADIVSLDKALTDFGFPVGPITLLDEVGIDVAAKVGKIMYAAFGDRMVSSDATEKLVADGRLGRKSKKGFYTYDGRKKQVDETVYALLPHGKNRKNLDRAEMAERCVLQMVNEAIRCLGEGVLRSARDGDIGAIFGLGFPPFLGGPFRYADTVGLKTLLERMLHYQQKWGNRFEPAPLLVEYAQAGRRFYP